MVPGFMKHLTFVVLAVLAALMPVGDVRAVDDPLVAEVLALDDDALMAELTELLGDVLPEDQIGLDCSTPDKVGRSTYTFKKDAVFEQGEESLTVKKFKRLSSETAPAVYVEGVNQVGTALARVYYCENGKLRQRPARAEDI